MKNTLIALVIVVALGAGAFWLFGAKAPENALPKTVLREGTALSVNLEQAAFDGPVLITLLTEEGEATIAIPSMGLPLCPAATNIADPYQVAKGDRVSVAGMEDKEGRIVPCEDESHHLTVYSFLGDQAFGYEFSYRKGPDGYVSREVSEPESATFSAGLALFNAREYAEFEQSTEPREGPPAITLRIYENPEKLRPGAWVARNPLQSNGALALEEPKETTIAGANAVFYTVDGLYPMDTYVVANDSRIYVLSGAYLEAGSAIHQDFGDIVASFSFPARAAEQE